MTLHQKTTSDSSPQAQNAMAKANPCQALNPGGGNPNPSEEPKIGLPGDVDAPITEEREPGSD